MNPHEACPELTKGEHNPIYERHSPGQEDKQRDRACR